MPGCRRRDRRDSDYNPSDPPPCPEKPPTAEPSTAQPYADFQGTYQGLTLKKIDDGDETQPRELNPIAIDPGTPSVSEAISPEASALADEITVMAGYELDNNSGAGQPYTLQGNYAKAGTREFGKLLWQLWSPPAGPNEGCGNWLWHRTLRYPYEVRDAKEYFDDVPDEQVPDDMLDLAHRIVESKSGQFAPEAFEDGYEIALRELLHKKQAGQPIRVVVPRGDAE
jgi:hypothetical protein